MEQNPPERAAGEPSLKAFASFESPPVTEVVLGVQFEELPRFGSVHAGLYWQDLKSRYPDWEEHPPLPTVQEPLPSLSEAEVGLGLSALPPLRRLFFVEPSKHFLVQVQPSRFLVNWRRIEGQAPYPRFDAVFKRFQEEWTVFSRFLAHHRLDSPVVDQYELTYIDHVLEDDVALPAGIEQSTPVFSWSKAQSTRFLPSPRAVTVSLQFAFPEQKGNLHVTINHGQRAVDRKNVLLMNLTARGPAKADGSDLSKWFELAHEWVVQGFADLTSTAAHKKWGKHK